MEESEMEPTEEKDAPAPSPESGYCITIQVRPDGFVVSDPTPMEDTSYESETPETQGDVVPDLMTMVKHLLHVIKENPLGEEAASQMDEGFASGPGAMKADAAA